jgi:hypothetical protein
VFEFNHAGDAQANQQHRHNQAHHKYHKGSEAEFRHLAPTYPSRRLLLFPALAGEKVFIDFPVFHNNNKIACRVFDELDVVDGVAVDLKWTPEIGPNVKV